MSQWIVDACLVLGWYLKDEDDRTYNLDIPAGLRANEAIVPLLWTYEVSLNHQLTVYDAAYLELAIRLNVPMVTKDSAIKRAMSDCGVAVVQP